MIRGTSAKFKFTLPCDFSELESAKIVFWQKDNSGPDESRPLPIIKILDQCEQSINTNELYISLNQEETLRFTDDEKAYVQLVVETTYGKHIASREEMITVYPIYDDEILDDDILPTPGYNPDGTVIKIDSALSETSKNPVQNKVITTQLKQIQHTIDTIYLQLDDDIAPNLLPSVTTYDNNKILRVVDGVWKLVDINIDSDDINTDETLSIAGAAADAKVTGDRINELSAQIADILYEPIDIVKFNNSVGVVEIGSVVDIVTLTWTLNKIATTQSVNSDIIDASITSLDLDRQNKTEFVLRVTDERGSTDTDTTYITFVNGVYYGVVNSGITIDNDVILGLTRKLQGSKSITFTTTAGDKQHLVYALPTSYGIPGFNVGGFDGGFHLYETFNFTNSSGHTELYNIYISDNHGLGKTTVKVS
jgi:hypothetical protein